MVSTLSRTQKVEVAEMLDTLAWRKKYHKIKYMYPDSGPLCRGRYPQQMAFFALGSEYSVRGLMAGNRTGKTEGGGGYEVVCHLTGEYPDWWQGRRFDDANSWWAAGDSNETVRDIIQAKMIGKHGEEGTGLIPAQRLGKVRYRTNGNGAVDTVKIQHMTGRWSELGFKSYEQGRKSFQGTEKDGIWLDEEANEGIRAECMMRLMTTKGLLIETFTPLKGLTEIVMRYLPEGYQNERIVKTGDRALVMAGWDDVPHLSDAEKTRMFAECEPHLIDARSKGIPHIGSGSIYPVPETEVLVDDFAVPAYWPRVYSLDVGWNRTAAVFAAHDKDSDIVYIYSEHYRGQAEPSVHAEAIRARGKMPGVIDPAARGRSQGDGQKLVQQYRDLGLELTFAKNAVESGLYAVWQRMSSGRLKVFRSCLNWIKEFRMYRRDDKGNIVKENDHLMDATRYLEMSGLQIARVVDTLQEVQSVHIPKVKHYY